MATYTVKAGDSLSMIAEHVLGHTSLWPALALENSIKKPYEIFPGQVLQLPSANTLSVVGANPPAPSSAMTLPAAKVNRFTSWFSRHKVLLGGGLLFISAIVAYKKSH